MTLPNYFHEAHRALDGMRHEFTAVSSVSATGINGVPHACDLALRGLYAAATGSPFPANDFRPHHQPEVLSKKLGINSRYSDRSQQFLREVTGRALSDARYPESDAHAKYTHATSSQVSYYLIEQAEWFVHESESLATDPTVLAEIRETLHK
jgi:hypothetical protein